MYGKNYYNIFKNTAIKIFKNIFNHNIIIIEKVKGLISAHFHLYFLVPNKTTFFFIKKKLFGLESTDWGGAVGRRLRPRYKGSVAFATLRATVGAKSGVD